MATAPTDDVLEYGNKLTGYGKEMEYLELKGYIYDPDTSMMIKP